MNAYVFQDAALPAEREPLSPFTRRSLLAVIVALHVAGGWALFNMQTAKLVIGDVAPLEVRMVAAEQPPTPPAEAQLPPPPEELEPPVIDPPPPVETPPPQVELAVEPPPPDLPPPEFPVEVKPTPPPPPPKPKQVIKPVHPAPPKPVAAPAAPAAPPTPEPPTGPRTVSATEVQATNPVNASYPARSRKLGETGTAMVRLLIDTEGRPTQVSLQTSSSHPLLDEEALAAVRKARFKPYTAGGSPQAVWVLIPIKFVLQ